MLLLLLLMPPLFLCDVNNTHVALQVEPDPMALLVIHPPMCRVIITDTVISGSIVCFPAGPTTRASERQELGESSFQ